MAVSLGFLQRDPVMCQNLTPLLELASVHEVLSSFLPRLRMAYLGKALTQHADGMSIVKAYGKVKPHFDQAITTASELLGSNSGTLKIIVHNGSTFILFYLNRFIRRQIVDSGDQEYFVGLSLLPS